MVHATMTSLLSLSLCSTSNIDLIYPNIYVCECLGQTRSHFHALLLAIAQKDRITSTDKNHDNMSVRLVIWSIDFVNIILKSCLILLNHVK